eukprot:symbB.v1.2.001020.t3/scaffold52.1/size380577/10
MEFAEKAALDSDQARKAVELSGSIYQLLSVPHGWEDVRVESIRCWVQIGEVGEIVIRGTVLDLENQMIDSLQNLCTDVKAALVCPEWLQEECPNAKVHQGFLEACNCLWAELERKGILQKIHGNPVEAKPTPMKLMGHSLGGAIATLLAVRLKLLGCEVQVVTFGSPRVGDDAFKALYHQLHLHQTTARYTLLLDPVTFLPPNHESLPSPIALLLGQLTATALGGTYVHVCEPCPLDAGTGFIRVAELATFVCAKNVSGVIGRLAEFHSMQCYKNALLQSSAPVTHVCAEEIVKILAANAPNTGVLCNLASTGAFALMSQGVTLASAGVSALASYLLWKKMNVACKQLHNLQHKTEGIQEDVKFLLEQVKDLGARIDSQSQMLAETIRDEAQKAVLRKTQLELDASIKWFSDHARMKQVEMSELESQFQKLQVGWYTLEGAFDPKHEIDTKHRLAMLPLLLDASRFLALVTQWVHSPEKASEVAATTYVRTALIFGKCCYADYSPEEDWLPNMLKQVNDFMSVVPGLAASTEDGAKLLHDTLTEMSLHELAMTVLISEPKSVVARYSVIQTCVKHKISDVKHESALAVLRSTPGTHPFDYFYAGAAFAVLTNVPGLNPASNANQCVIFWKMLLTEKRNPDILGDFRALKETCHTIDWELLSAEVERQNSIPLSLYLYLAGAFAESQQEWLLKNASLQDLVALDPNDVYGTEPLRHAKVCSHQQEAEHLLAFVESRLDRFSDLLVKTQLKPNDRECFLQIQAELKTKNAAVQDESDYVVVAGGVSAGKTTFVNAILSVLLKDRWNELEPEVIKQRGKVIREGIRTLLPTDFSENTAIITEVELRPPESPDFRCTLKLLESRLDQFEVVWSENFDNLKDVAAKVGNLATTKPDKKKPLRRLRMCIPCEGLTGNPLTLVDTPGMESPGVREQVLPMIACKAFLFVWIAAFNQPQVFGAQGHELLNAYHSFQMPFPPILVPTKWDLAKNMFGDDLDRLDDHVRKRLKTLTDALQSETFQSIHANAVTSREIDLIKSSLAEGVLLEDICISEQLLPRGAKLVSQFSEEPPASLHFQVSVGTTPPLLFAANAYQVLESASSIAGVVDQPTEDMQCFWKVLVPMLKALSVPIKVCKRLAHIREALQAFLNQILANDPEACRMTGRHLLDLKKIADESVKKLESDLKFYFKHVPKTLEEIDKWTDFPQHQLDSYKDYVRPLSIYQSKLENPEDPMNHLLDDLAAIYMEIANGKEQVDPQQLLDLDERMYEQWLKRYTSMVKIMEEQAEEQLNQAVAGVLNEHDADMLARFKSARPEPKDRPSILGVAVSVGYITAMIGMGLVGTVAGPVGMVAGGLAVGATTTLGMFRGLQNFREVQQFPKLSRWVGSRWTKQEAVDAVAEEFLLRAGDARTQAHLIQAALDRCQDRMNEFLDAFANHRFGDASSNPDAQHIRSQQEELDKAYILMAVIVQNDMERRLSKKEWLVIRTLVKWKFSASNFGMETSFGETTPGSRDVSREVQDPSAAEFSRMANKKLLQQGFTALGCTQGCDLYMKISIEKNPRTSLRSIGRKMRQKRAEEKKSAIGLQRAPGSPVQVLRRAGEGVNVDESHVLRVIKLDGTEARIGLWDPFQMGYLWLINGG